jgi:ankyrin repeat protein
MGKLTDAIFEGNAKQVRKLLDTHPILGGYKGSSAINEEKSTQDSYRESSALHLACCLGNVEIVDMLLKVNAEVRQDENTFFTVAANNHVGVLKLLIDEFGNDIDTPREADNSYSLIIASCLGRLESVRFLLDNKVTPPNKKTKLGETALYAAVENGHVEVARLLMAHGANTYAKTIYGKTPYSLAMESGSVEMKKIFEDYHNDLESKFFRIESRIEDFYKKISELNRKKEKINEILKNKLIEGGKENNAGINENSQLLIFSNVKPSAPAQEVGSNLSDSEDLIDFFDSILGFPNPT